MSAPIIEFDGTTYTITLFRADNEGAIKKEYLVFGEHSLSVCAAHECELNSWERSQIKATPDTEGTLYYIHAQPLDVGAATFVGLKDKDEAFAVKKVLLFFEENEDAVHGLEEEPCSFCGNEGCEGDHGDDMRDWQRAALERD